MKKMFALAAVALLTLGQTGCSSCGRSFGSWFNRGDSCAPPACAPAGCGAGSGWQQRGAMFAPTSQPMVLPGPIEVAPLQ